MSNEQDDHAYMNQLRTVMNIIEGQAHGHPKPPQHPVSPPLNIGTPDPKLRNINDR